MFDSKLLELLRLYLQIRDRWTTMEAHFLPVLFLGCSSLRFQLHVVDVTANEFEQTCLIAGNCHICNTHYSFIRSKPCVLNTTSRQGK